MTRWHRLAYLLLAVGGLAVLLLLIRGLTAQINDAEDRLSEAERAAQTNAARLEDAQAAVGSLADQVRRLGARPVTTVRGEPVLVQGPRGATGPAGPAGARGQRGAAGRDGADGARGPAGRDGADGADGAPGPAGPAGEDGEAGPKGEQGEQGPAGYPDEIVYTDPGTPAPGDETTYRCTDPDGDRTYTCEPSP